jgi:hypothetical protein
VLWDSVAAAREASQDVSTLLEASGEEASHRELCSIGILFRVASGIRAHLENRTSPARVSHHLAAEDKDHDSNSAADPIREIG